ncbi:hypothetical protein I6A84_10690 [Frankia sp. CNm7]|uniref:Uncharacterized protein n=1 Tax=Frankia nepalensis TaxID=1836974 RepID=A0A937RCJ0_9ACTN|nr:hypothetical protein [Frankia nepalensis]MBL7495354.1 hypothetical protein [Frankia nepalensis]MBL7514488.1 hypothetical protein [Frankia nepalensis]MBL7518564.1 hypothetical protein [Frankia nepalensis]MBL7627757.1 hypothetical protein [Frankia nepalensis]
MPRPRPFAGTDTRTDRNPRSEGATAPPDASARDPRPGKVTPGNPRPGGASRVEEESSELWKKFAIAGALLIGIAGVLTTCSGGKASDPNNPLGSAYVASTVGDDAISEWYDGTRTIRGRIATDVAEIRAHLDAQDGAALQPTCTTLADDLTEARALTPGPDSAAQNLFDTGLNGYGDGVTACGNLFDGTQVAVSELQQRMRAGLTRGDEQWAALATLVGLPVATAGPLPASSTAAPTTTQTTVPPTTTTPPRPAPTTARPRATTRPPVAPTTAATTPPVATPTAPPATTSAAPSPSPSRSVGTPPTFPTFGGA